MKRSSIYGLLLVALFPALCRPVAAQVKVWQGTFALPTYEEGQPDPNPPFDIYQTKRFNYPYTLRTNLTGVKVTHEWRAVFLENEYLKCTVLPDIGGHLYTCIDKISGQPMFYANPSIKKAKIGYRGAWAAFGVEFNFPVSHNWASMSPVDFAYASHADGSGSVWVGNTDRAYGMRWEVELILKPGSTLLEERVTLYNRSDVRHRYYWWNNAAVQVWDDSRVDYPMRYVASHGFTDVYRWPVDAEGKDLSLIKNQTDGAVSFFVHGSHEPFMAIWNPHTQTGTAHYAEYQDLPGKKIWSWGVDQAGLDWRTALSDNNSAYVEVQAGLFRNQETYSFLEPGHSIRFSEYWIPVRGTGGISRANKAGAVYFDKHGSDVAVSLNVNERHDGAQLALTENGKIFWSGSEDLAPDRTWSHTVARGTGKIGFELKDREGRSLLKQTDGEYDWDPDAAIKTGHQQEQRIAAPAQSSEDDWLHVGEVQELNGEAVLALGTYKSGLEKFPQSQSLLIAEGRLAASLQHHEEAERALRLAQERDTPNSEIAYYLGIAEEGLGHTREAATSYEIAYRQADLRGPAAMKLGELRARDGDLEGAAMFLKAAVVADAEDFRAREQLEAVLRGKGERAEADRLAHLGLASDPTNDFLKEEAGTPDVEHLAADPYRVLQVATEYMQLGFYRRAFEVLDRVYPSVPMDQSEPGTVVPQRHPLVRYYAAFCKEKSGEGTKRDWQVASERSPRFVFPSSETDKIVLKAALAANRNDATAHTLLGTLLFSKGETEAGSAEWTEAKRIAPRLQTIDVDLGDYFLKLKNDPQSALTAFREALKNDPENAEVYAGLDAAMSVTGTSAVERADLLSQYPLADAPDSKMPADLVYQLALTRAEANQYERALAPFKDRFFPSEEGGVTSGQVLFEVRLMQAEAWAKAHNCAQAEDLLAGKLPGMGLGGKTARDYVRLAGIAQSCGKAKESEALLHRAVASTDSADLAWAIKAKQTLGTYDERQANEEISKSLSVAESRIATSGHPGLLRYSIGMLEAALHRKVEAREAFEQVLILPDSEMSHHFAREALAELSAGK